VKKALHTTLKLLLVLTIFLGLQGKVIIRYLEIFHKNHKSEIVHTGATRVKNGIIHCKLQCYTQHFQVLDIPPVAALFFFLITTLLIVDLLYISFKEKLLIADSVRLLPLRAPPVF
jgi:hypothetical protein